ncbi:MAG: AAA family ATPase [Gammaproteobacteria bacterium]|nr:AAA family ATPase [Gammaproteobacteria bacterium]
MSNGRRYSPKRARQRRLDIAVEDDAHAPVGKSEESAPTETARPCVLIEQLHLRSLLSFGQDSPPVELGPLNVLIGPNGSGKSNLIHAVDLLRHLPEQGPMSAPDGTKPSNWSWRGHPPKAPLVSIGARLSIEKGTLAYELKALATRTEFTPVEERLFALTKEGDVAAVVFDRSNKRFNPGEQLGLALKRLESEVFPLTYALGRIAIHRNWAFGAKAPMRTPQVTALPSDTLQDDAANLGLVLNRLNQDTASKERLINGLRQLYEGIEDFRVNIEKGKVFLDLKERGIRFPASHLSDGTLRFLCLLAILNEPEPPPLICLEEPELGLHPDILPAVGELLIEASTRTQLIVTTHSDVLVDALSDTPESVIVCEKHEGQTHLKRLEKREIAGWLGRYSNSLGELWTRGHLGGNR